MILICISNISYAASFIPSISKTSVNVGDTITIKGKVKSIGEVLGYSIDIAEVY